jgi:hypothetical protein
VVVHERAKASGATVTVDVLWDDVPLVRAAQAREQDGGWFVEIEQPMPVGTKLQLSGEASAAVQVARVHEGLGSGMLLRRADSQQPTADSSKPEAESDNEFEEEEKTSGGSKKQRRRRRR